MCGFFFGEILGIKVKEKKPSLSQPIVSSSSIVEQKEQTTLKYISKTPNFRKHDRSDLLDEDSMIILNKLSPIFKKYIEQQDTIESRNPYLTSIKLYTPQTRKTFYEFINNCFISSCELFIFYFF